MHRYRLHYFGIALNDQSLTPAPTRAFGPTHFGDWPSQLVRQSKKVARMTMVPGPPLARKRARAAGGS